MSTVFIARNVRGIKQVISLLLVLIMVIPGNILHATDDCRCGSFETGFTVYDTAEDGLCCSGTAIGVGYTEVWVQNQQTSWEYSHTDYYQNPADAQAICCP